MLKLIFPLLSIPLSWRLNGELVNVIICVWCQEVRLDAIHKKESWPKSHLFPNFQRKVGVGTVCKIKGTNQSLRETFCKYYTT